MSAKQIKPTTLVGIKRYAHQLKKAEAIPYLAALDRAAQAAGYQNFRHAQSALDQSAGASHGSMATGALATNAGAAPDLEANDRFQRYSQHRAGINVNSAIKAERASLALLADDGPQFADTLNAMLRSFNPHRYTPYWLFGVDAPLATKWSIASAEMIATRLAQSGSCEGEARERLVAECVCDVLCGQGFAGYIIGAMTTSDGTIVPRSAHGAVLAFKGVLDAIALAERAGQGTIFEQGSSRQIESLLKLGEFFDPLETLHAQMLDRLGVVRHTQLRSVNKTVSVRWGADPSAA